MTLKTLESRLENVEGKHSTMGKEQCELQEEIDKSRNDNHLLFQQLMQSMQLIHAQSAELKKLFGNQFSAMFKNGQPAFLFLRK